MNQSASNIYLFSGCDKHCIDIALKAKYMFWVIECHHEVTPTIWAQCNILSIIKTGMALFCYDRRDKSQPLWWCNYHWHCYVINSIHHKEKCFKCTLIDNCPYIHSIWLISYVLIKSNSSSITTAHMFPVDKGAYMTSPLKVQCYFMT